VQEGLESSSFAKLSRTFLTGITLTAQLGLDLVQMLQPSRAFSSAVFGDTSITIPLLRGAGRHIAAEPLTQTEREVLYAIQDFEQFKKEFSVGIADRYFAALQTGDQLHNQEENYRGLIASSRRASRLAEAGKTPKIQVDQSLQNELRARDRWIAARQSYFRAIDQFKIVLGLPTDANILLDRQEFSKLESLINARLVSLFAAEESAEIPPADAPVTLVLPADSERGIFELEESEAIRIALAQRFDLRNQLSRVEDAQRQVVVAADALGPELTLFGSVSLGEQRSLGSAASASSRHLDLSKGTYQSLLTLNLPLERTAEANAYRDSYVQLEQAVRAAQVLEDQIKLQVRDQLRNLEQARASLKVQNQAVKLAERRVRGAALNLEAGRAAIRDLLEAQESLLTAQNGLTGAMIDYRLAELRLQRDLGTLQVDSTGLWLETFLAPLEEPNNGTKR
jgi:outer membrane protein TolC